MVARNFLQTDAMLDEEIVRCSIASSPPMSAARLREYLKVEMEHMGIKRIECRCSPLRCARIWQRGDFRCATIARWTTGARRQRQSHTRQEDDCRCAQVGHGCTRARLSKRTARDS